MLESFFRIGISLCLVVGLGISGIFAFFPLQTFFVFPHSSPDDLGDFLYLGFGVFGFAIFLLLMCMLLYQFYKIYEDYQLLKHGRKAEGTVTAKEVDDSADGSTYYYYEYEDHEGQKHKAETFAGSYGVWGSQYAVKSCIVIVHSLQNPQRHRWIDGGWLRLVGAS